MYENNSYNYYQQQFNSANTAPSTHYPTNTSNYNNQTQSSNFPMFYSQAQSQPSYPYQQQQQQSNYQLNYQDQYQSSYNK
jgi:hypothetical protein